ncbi:hypothetical protein Tco_1077717, partial [Tanacetum coccineum]
QEAILRMHGKLVHGKHVSVYLAKTQLRSYGEDFQTDDVTRVKPCKCFSLQPISETTKVLDVLALIIDIEYMSQEKLSSCPTTDLQPHSKELQHVLNDTLLGIVKNYKFNSNYKSNSNGNMCGDVPIEIFNLVDAIDFLGGELLGMGKESDTSNIHSQLYSKFLEKSTVCCSFSNFPLHPNIIIVPSTSLSVNLSPTRDSLFIQKQNPPSTQLFKLAVSTKASDCHGICSKALRFAKIMQDKKSISKNKERDTGRMTSRIKKKCKGKARKNNILHVDDDDHSCSISQKDLEDDESLSMYTLGCLHRITSRWKRVAAMVSAGDVVEVAKMVDMVLWVASVVMVVAGMTAAAGGYEVEGGDVDDGDVVVVRGMVMMMTVVAGCGCRRGWRRVSASGYGDRLEQSSTCHQSAQRNFVEVKPHQLYHCFLSLGLGEYSFGGACEKSATVLLTFA